MPDAWGADELAYLSRYDGLRFIRLNSHGAYCLDMTPKYAPTVRRPRMRFSHVAGAGGPSLRAAGRPVPPADRLFLERFAEQESETRWRLERGPLLAAIEAGLPLEEIRRFLQERVGKPLADEIGFLLDDVDGSVRGFQVMGHGLIAEISRTGLAQVLATDKVLRKSANFAEGKYVIIRAGVEDAVRKRMRALGFALPGREG